TATFRLVVHVNSTAPVGDQISNTAIVTTTTNETNANNNRGFSSADIEAAPMGLPECNINTLNQPGQAGTAVIVEDADNPGSNVLLVTGTSRGDVIVVEPQPRSQGLMRVVQNKHIIVTFISTDVQRIVIFGQQGNDRITVSGALFQPATIFGGDGNDTIVG